MNSNLSLALSEFGFDTPEQQQSFLYLLLATKCPFIEDLESTERRKNIKQLQENGNDIQNLSFIDVKSAKEWLLNVTQTMWFRSTWEKETLNNKDSATLLIQRWLPNSTAYSINNQQFNEETKKKFIQAFKTLGLVDRIFPQFKETEKPSVVLWLGNLQPDAEIRIRNGIPQVANDDIDVVVHSNRRGLNILLEPFCLAEIAKAHDLDEKKLFEVCKSFLKSPYELAYSKLKDATEPLRKHIMETFSLSHWSYNVNPYLWPTEKELYNYLFEEGKKNNYVPNCARLVFDNPEPRTDNKLWDTFTQALEWSKKYLINHPGTNLKPNVLVWSNQPFGKSQIATVERALGSAFNVFGSAVEFDMNKSPSIPIFLENLAKIIYEKSM